MNTKRTFFEQVERVTIKFSLFVYIGIISYIDIKNFIADMFLYQQIFNIIVCFIAFWVIASTITEFYYWLDKQDNNAQNIKTNI